MNKLFAVWNLQMIYGRDAKRKSFNGGRKTIASTQLDYDDSTIHHNFRLASSAFRQICLLCIRIRSNGAGM